MKLGAEASQCGGSKFICFITREKLAETEMQKVLLSEKNWAKW